MSVVDIITIKFCCVTFNCNFFNCVLNFTAFCIFRQICEIVCPVAGCCYYLAVYFFSICKKIYGNAFRTFSILVIVVIPMFASINGNSLWFMCIVDIITAYSGNISFYCFLSYSINNFLTCFKFRQICKAVCPVSVVIRFYFLRIHFITVCKKVYSNFLRSDSILVIAIVPCLDATYFCFCCIMSIGNVVIIYDCSVAIYKVFTYRINNFFTILIFVKIIECVFPVICYSYFLRFNFYSVCKEVDCDAVWADTVLVVTVVPCLSTFNFSRLRCMRVGNYCKCSI